MTQIPRNQTPYNFIMETHKADTLGSWNLLTRRESFSSIPPNLHIMVDPAAGGIKPTRGI